jgi:hypothetical protein
MAHKLIHLRGPKELQADIERLSLIIRSAQKCLEDGRRGDALKILKTALPQVGTKADDKSDGAA